MRIALLCNAYPPEFVGGTELVVSAQARELQRAGHQVRVVCGSANSTGFSRIEVEEVEGIEVQRIAKTHVESRAAHTQFPRIARLVDEATHGFDLVHLHHWSSLSGDLVRRLSRRVPVVVTLHDHFASCPLFFRTAPHQMGCPQDRPTSACVHCVEQLTGARGFPDLHQQLVERWTNFRAELQNAACVICPSESLLRAMARELDLESTNWQVIGHGLCQNLAPSAPRATADSRLRVLSFGNRSTIKGTLDLVLAMAALPPGSARLTLAGKEVEEGFDDSLRAAAGELELEMTDTYNADDLTALAADADLAAFPSRAHESYGLVIEEALALGLPVWVSDRGALGEVLTRCAGKGPLPGGILPAQDPAAWQRALSKLVECPSKLQDARRLVPDRSRPAEQAVQRLLELYAKILHGQAAA